MALPNGEELIWLGIAFGSDVLQLFPIKATG